MLLSAQHIRREIGAGRLSISPFEDGRLKPASYVLSLGFRFRRWRMLDEPLRPWSPAAARAHLDEIVEADTIFLGPREFMLGCTIEKLGLPADLFGMLSPLSHVARFGLTVHCGADFANPGFGADKLTALTLELSNHNPSPIELRAGMPVAHLRIGRVEGSTDFAPRRRSIYEGADPLVEPQLFEEWSDGVDGSRNENPDFA